MGDSVPVAGAPTTSGQPCGLALHACGLALLRRAIPGENVFGLSLAGRAKEVRHHDGIYESPPGRGGQSRRWVAEASTGRQRLRASLGHDLLIAARLVEVEQDPSRAGRQSCHGQASQAGR